VLCALFFTVAVKRKGVQAANPVLRIGDPPLPILSVYIFLLLHLRYGHDGCR
jgi:hypothetical protein